MVSGGDDGRTFRYAVEADDRDVRRHRDAVGLEPVERDRARSRPTGQEAPSAGPVRRRSPPARHGLSAPPRLSRRSARQRCRCRMRAQRLERAVHALARRRVDGPLHLVRRRAAVAALAQFQGEDGETAMAEPDQMLRRNARAGDIVDADDRNALVRLGRATAPRRADCARWRSGSAHAPLPGRTG